MQGCGFWSILYEMPWSSLRFWNHYRQKTVSVWTWNMKYLLPISFSGRKFFICQLSDSLKMRKILIEKIIYWKVTFSKFSAGWSRGIQKIRKSKTVNSKLCNLLRTLQRKAFRLIRSPQIMWYTVTHWL